MTTEKSGSVGLNQEKSTARTGTRTLPLLPASATDDAVARALKESVLRLRAEAADAESEELDGWKLTLVRGSDLTAVLDEVDRLMLVNGQIAKMWCDSEDRSSQPSSSSEGKPPEWAHEDFIVDRPSASEITEAIDAMLFAQEEVVANAKGCDTRPGSAKRLAAARSRLESLYLEQLQEIERLRGEQLTEAEARLLLSGWWVDDDDPQLFAKLLRLIPESSGSTKGTAEK